MFGCLPDGGRPPRDARAHPLPLNGRACREDEVRKTTDAELSILKWTENTKGAPRTLDCKEIAK